MKQSALALLLGSIVAVRVNDIDANNGGSKDVGVVGYDPFVRGVIHDNVEPYPAIPRSKHQIVPDSWVAKAKKEAAEKEDKKAGGADAAKEGDAKKEGAAKEGEAKADAPKEEAKADAKKEEAPKADAPKEGLVQTEVAKPVHYSKQFGLWLEDNDFVQWSQHDFAGNPERVHILDPVTYQDTANAGSYLGNKRTSFYAQQASDDNMLQWS